ncbi:Phage regulatory protein Rha (Phage_pRha) [Pseudomonas sp. LAMO17WK12:I6]|uniref:Rha family transcriptional regulator n=1 Tax=unclassified Pseudomonas TaxID=196821 RepID=UPI000BDD6AF7|nr:MULTISPECIES: Rha family transcriptional regulator [unclassified Pseudomonas]SNY42212.1 Phage regulatory protein Rha (Phage_pRha) [Pseudomonas sp. LAMO17WK12:I6]SNY43808.1 Phage regulatory protein Rha (Phage_pRha) [Pseudomonas sp. LAMO17WK12:I5]
MHQSIQTINTPASVATRFSNSENVSRTTMSSREIADLTGKRHPDVKRDIQAMAKDLLEDVSSFAHIYLDGMNRQQTEYLLDREHTDCLLTGYSVAMRMAVIKRWRELEEGAGKVIATLPNFADPVAAARAWADQVEQKQVAEQARLQLAIQVEAQATKIHSMENLFKEGMTPSQFCKGLNGVNVMQVGKFLEGRNWLYNESKSGLRFRVASYARDKYMTEHQHEVTPHGREPFVSFTPVLLKKGAVRLYDLYLAGELPMKKNWDGLFTHDKALRAA